MLHISSEEVLEYDAHDQKGQKRRKQAPKHTEVCALVFLLEIPLDQLGEEEAVLFEFLNGSEHKAHPLTQLFDCGIFPHNISNYIITQILPICKTFFATLKIFLNIFQNLRCKIFLLIFTKTIDKQPIRC